jgi:acylglycerol lipase
MTEHIVETADGLRLHVERHEASGGAARAALVIIHGFSPYAGLYRPVGEAFARAAIDVTMFDCRGHGHSQGRRGYVRRFSDFQDDLHLVVEMARAKAPPGLPLALLGHSHGATIALDYVLAGRGPVDAMLLACPYLALKMKVPAVKRVMSPVMGALWPTLAMSNGIRAEDITRSPAVRAAFREDPLIHHVATPRWFNEVTAAQAHIVANAPTLRVPTFMALAGDDRLVSSEAAQAFARAAGAIVEVRVYDGLFHEIYLEPDPDGPRVVSDLVAWLDRRLRSHTAISAGMPA